ncbi:hypothetical protein SAMN04487948_13026 [Halogranum amylolyticum]|uniref:Uncharacterized protein n=1 Tax=Halogranum amylolyticum TaxID=660520 RepID=A0A1H8WJJ6_9EURY|nr:hypothetical protein SAMN04487948_13026 [Halogranum amylolyticum]
MVLIGLVAFGGAAAWLGYRHLTWASAAVGTIISIIGVMSIGWYFMFPTLCLLIAAIALTVKARRESTGRRPTRFEESTALIDRRRIEGEHREYSRLSVSRNALVPDV